MAVDICGRHGHRLTRHLAGSSLLRRGERSKEKPSAQRGVGGTRLMFSGEGGRAGTGRKQGWSNGSQAAVQTGRDLPLFLPVGDVAVDAVSTSLMGGANKIASRQPPK